MRRARVAVAMSGGVDSAVAALLLSDAGYDVIGVTLKLWCYGETEDRSTHRSCCSLRAIEDARAACDVIGVPHYVLDFEERFTESVIDRFVAEYLAGRTPNPCVLCNQHVKLGAVLDRTRAFGAELVATGHHARLSTTDAGPVVTRARDRGKDQTYALWAVPREVMGRTLMPVGDHAKDDIREMARRRGLPVAEKPESQDICFVPDRDYGRFVAGRAGSGGAGLRPGPIVDGEGRHVGTHQGVARYTVGQRRGLGISHAEPLYVVGIDAEAATVRVGPRSALAARGLVADSTNWISIDGLDGPRRVIAQIRYRHPGAPATVMPRGAGEIEVRFDEPQDAVTPGQSAVFYEGDVLLGGGVIREALSAGTDRPGG